MKSSIYRLLLAAGLLLTVAVYWSGLSGSFLFDDYPNIVENHAVQPRVLTTASLTTAAFSSPASDFKRPLASLSFAANYLVTGLDPYWMKLTNLVIHLLNGILVFVLTRQLLRIEPAPRDATTNGPNPHRANITAALIATGWLLLPINLTAVLYVVQRMESLANLFVLAGLIGYVAGRQRMQDEEAYRSGLAICALSITVPTALGLLAKETAVMLPLYAALIELVVFRFRRTNGNRDHWITAVFVLVLALPLIIGLAWLLPGLFRSATWATRDFTLGTRLLSEARVVTGYIGWILLPTPNELSFYHDDFQTSAGLLTPWTTLGGIVVLAALVALSLKLRRRAPIASLGLMLFLGSHLLTGTVIPLELIYEHRNYFASFGLLLAIVPPLIPRPSTKESATFFAVPRLALLTCLMFWWMALTALTAHAWSGPLRLAEELAMRSPESPRAQYELGRTYIVYSHYDPASPFVKLAYPPLERAAALPGSSILPQQALIFMNSRMRLPVEDSWWSSMVAKLKARKPGVQDESSLAALTQCARERRCDLPQERMVGAFIAALSHPNPSPRLLATYGDYAWNVLDDRTLGLRLLQQTVKLAPGESAYRVTEIRMLAAAGRNDEAKQELQQLVRLNFGGSLNATLEELHTSLEAR